MYIKKTELKFSNGFTLVELLIVIALIIIISGVILIVTRDSKGKANRAAFFSEAQGAIHGLILQCNSGPITVPTISNNITWGLVSSSCDATGNGNFCLSAVNKNNFVNTNINECTVYVGMEGVYNDNLCTIRADSAACP